MATISFTREIKLNEEGTRRFLEEDSREDKVIYLEYIDIDKKLEEGRKALEEFLGNDNILRGEEAKKVWDEINEIPSEKSRENGKKLIEKFKKMTINDSSKFIVNNNKTEEFINDFNKNVINEEFLKECKETIKLFKKDCK